MVGSVPFGRAGTAIIQRTEIIARFAKSGSRPVWAIAPGQAGRAGRDVEGGPMSENARRRIRVIDDQHEALGFPPARRTNSAVARCQRRRRYIPMGSRPRAKTLG
jgi:hypothetical protein